MSQESDSEKTLKTSQTAADTEKPSVLPSPPVKNRSSLARRISSRTTDLLAIAIVLIGSLTLGRQILEWWRADPPEVLDPSPLAELETEWGTDGKPVEMEFAGSPIKLIRQTVSRGGPLVALGLVQEACQRAVLAAQQLRSPPDRAELELIELVAKRKSEVEQPGEWQIHRLGGNMVTLVGIRFFPSSAEKNDETHPHTVPRVVCWGLVFPGHPSGTWTAYTFVKSNPPQNQQATPTESDGSSELDLGQIQLPEGCQRTLLVRETARNSLLGFQGKGQADEWCQHFSAWFTTQGWTLADDWNKEVETENWSASFTRQGQESDQAIRILIQIQFDASGQGSGLIHGLPGRR